MPFFQNKYVQRCPEGYLPDYRGRCVLVDMKKYYEQNPEGADDEEIADTPKLSDVLDSMKPKTKVNDN